jgi:microcystin degradation protein MlrC
MDDAEGDFLAALRQAVGPDCLIAASYDLHGNVSRRVKDCDVPV